MEGMKESKEGRKKGTNEIKGKKERNPTLALFLHG